MTIGGLSGELGTVFGGLYFGLFAIRLYTGLAFNDPVIFLHSLSLTNRHVCHLTSHILF